MSDQNYPNLLQEGKILWGYYVSAITTNNANYTGRAGRKEFWGFMLFNALIFRTLLLLGLTVYTRYAMGTSSRLDFIVSSLVGTKFRLFSIFVYITMGLILFTPSLSVVVRRLHDRGLSGWWYGGFLLGSVIVLIASSFLSAEYAYFTRWIVARVALVYYICLFVLCSLDSKPEENKWGVSPKNNAVNAKL